MERFTEVEESRYQADFAISENFIKFSGELLRLSLLAIGGFGALILLKIQDGDKLDVFPDPKFFVLALVCFVISSGASLVHRYFATDAISWFIGVLRAKDKNDIPEIVNERKGPAVRLIFDLSQLITGTHEKSQFQQLKSNLHQLHLEEISTKKSYSDLDGGVKEHNG